MPRPCTMYDEGPSIELWVPLDEIQAMADMVSWSLCVLLLKSQISPTLQQPSPGKPPGI